MRIIDLYPIGTVVRLKDGEKRLMITGVKQTNLDGDGEEYDYISVLYPEGHLGENFQYLFYHEDIEEVFFKGYEDEERNTFIQKLSEIYKD